MAIQYTTITEHDLGGGIDARNSENLIAESFAADILNGDTLESRVLKRVGYQGHAGDIPVRVFSVEEVTGEDRWAYILADGIDLLSVRSSPLVVYGRTGPGEADTLRYYPEFYIDPRKPMPLGFNTVVVTNDEHKQGTANLLVGLAESTSNVNLSHRTFIPQELTVDEGDYEISIEYDQDEDADKELLVYYLAKDISIGSTHVVDTSDPGTFSSDDTPGISGVRTIIVDAATHQLNNFQIIPEFYRESAGIRQRVIPSSMTVADDGLITIRFESQGGPDPILTDRIVVILSSAPASNLISGQAAGLSSSVAEIVVTDDTQKFPFVGCYFVDALTGTSELVLPDAIVYDDDTTDLDARRDLRVEFTNSVAQARNFEVYYEFGTITTNRLEVDETDSLPTAPDPSTEPQLTIWGLHHDEIYGGTTIAREGWANHIDSYRRSGEQRVVTGLGGNIFTARTYDEVSASHGLPLRYPRLRNRVDTNTIISPLFHETGSTPGRTRGYLTVDGASTNWVEVTDITWQSGNLVRYTLTLPGVVEVADGPTSGDLIADGLVTTSDQITFSDCGWNRHNGTFSIVTAVVTGTTLEVVVSNPLVDNADYDETEVCGLAGVFTDSIPLSSDSEYVPGDRVTSGAFTDANLHNVVTIPSTTSILVDGVFDTEELSAGIRLNGVRTSRIIPLRTITGTPDSQQYVEGDMLQYTGVSRKFRVLAVHPRGDVSISSIVGDGSTATVELDSPGPDTNPLSVGDTILLLRSGQFTGTWVVTQISDLTTIEVSCTVVGTHSDPGAVLAGHYIEIDEEFEWEDDATSLNTVHVDSRWIPVEAPTSDGNLVRDTYITHLDTNSYISQPTLRSTMAADNMYFTNGNDEVMKFDGTHIYRAGLPRWQPGAFITVDTAGTGITVPDVSITTSGPSSTGTSVLSFSSDTAGIFSSGNRISVGGIVYTVDRVTTSTSGSDRVYLTSPLLADVAASATVSLVFTYSYYFRLNAVDKNSNIIASATTGSNDFVVELGAESSVRIRLIGMPVFGAYDYDTIEVEIYRTLANQGAPYYKVATLPVSFNNGALYIDYEDTASDEVLTTLDPVASNLLGVELGTGWSQPLRAKYITSSDNRLILANLRDYPELDIQIESDSANQLSDYFGKRFLFRRDSSDTGTTTDMVNRAGYELRNAAAPSRTVTEITPIDGNTLKLTLSGIPLVVAGNWVYITNVDSSNPDLLVNGWYQVIASALIGTSITIRQENTLGAPVPLGAGFQKSVYWATLPADIPVVLGTDYNFGSRSGNSTLSPRTQVTTRLGAAINASMRGTDNTLGPPFILEDYTDFIPWMIAGSGGDFRAGQLVVRQPIVTDTTMELVLPEKDSDNPVTGEFQYDTFRIAVNDIFRSASDTGLATESTASTRERVYPSRAIQSYQNFPEIFDSPNETGAEFSDSVVDVNTADGQELTGIIPFFGESVTSAAQKEGIVLPFKQNSVYVYSTASRQPQRLETRGVGCTAPYSIAPSRDGINFASDSGIYQIDRSFRLRYVGRMVERVWENTVNRDRLDLVVGHHFALGRKYKLSVPVGEGSSNSDVLVYDHTREGQRGEDGSWTRYDSHPATGWCNLDQDAFFSSTAGRVFSIRRAGDDTDYRDDSQPISFDYRLRPNDFGDAGRRKVCRAVVTHLRATTDTRGTRLLVSRDLEEDYEETEFLYTPRDNTGGISGTVNKAIISILSSMSRDRFVYLQLRYTNSEIDEPVEIAGVDYRVGGLTEEGILQARGVVTSNS